MKPPDVTQIYRHAWFFVCTPKVSPVCIDGLFWGNDSCFGAPQKNRCHNLKVFISGTSSANSAVSPVSPVSSSMAKSLCALRFFFLWKRFLPPNFGRMATWHTKRHRQRYSAQCSAGKWLLIGDPQTFWS